VIGMKRVAKAKGEEFASRGNSEKGIDCSESDDSKKVSDLRGWMEQGEMGAWVVIIDDVDSGDHQGHPENSHVARQFLRTFAGHQLSYG
jgi:hypothetical protein